MFFNNALADFIRLFTLTDDTPTQRLTERLALVLRDPTAYQAQHAEELAERGIEAALPPQELRDVALADALWSEDLLWEADWQDPATEVTAGLQEIIEQQKRPQKLAVSSTATGPDMLDSVQDALEPLGLALVLLTLDSDSYPLSVVADAQAEELRGLARELGFTLTVY